MIAIFICTFAIMCAVGFLLYARRGSRIGEIIMWAGLVSLLTLVLVITFIERGSI